MSSVVRVHLPSQASSLIQEQDSFYYDGLASKQKRNIGPFSKDWLRDLFRKNYGHFKELQPDRAEIKKMIDHTSIFRTLHESYFHSKTCIHFAQLDFLLFQQIKANLAKEAAVGSAEAGGAGIGGVNGSVLQKAGESALHSIIKKSSVSESFYALINSSSKKCDAMIEFILWKYLWCHKSLNFSIDDMFIYKLCVDVPKSRDGQEA